MLRGHLFYKISRFFDCAHVRARRDLDHVGKAELLHCCDEFRHRHVFSKLPHKRRRDDGNDGVSFRNGADNLKNLALIDDGSKWAAHKALPAGNAAIIINPRLAVFVKPDGVHAARRLTGAFDERDGVVGAGARALAAADADGFVNNALAVCKGNRALGAHALARRCQTALTDIGHAVALRRTGMTGVGNDIDQRRLVVLLCDGGVIHSFGEKRPRLHGLKR